MAKKSVRILVVLMGVIYLLMQVNSMLIFLTEQPTVEMLTVFYQISFPVIWVVGLVVVAWSLFYLWSLTNKK